MIQITNVIKANGELSMTRKQPIEVADKQELEKVREQLRKHYGCEVYFIYREAVR